MSNSKAVVRPEALPPIIYKDQPVVPSSLLASLYGADKKQLRQNFANNRNRFLEGKHFFHVKGSALRELKRSVESFDKAIPTSTPQLILWTERGAVRHAKMLDTDKAWDVFELLEDCYFGKYAPKTVKLVDKPQNFTAVTSLTPEQQHAVKRAVDQIVREHYLSPRIAYSRTWSDLKDTFRVARYQDIPSSRFNEVMSFLGFPVPKKSVPTTTGDMTSVNTMALKGTLAMVKLIEEKRGELFEAHNDMEIAARRVSAAIGGIHDVLMDLPCHTRNL